MHSFLLILALFSMKESLSSQYIPPFNTCPAVKMVENIRRAYIKKYWNIAELRKVYAEKQIITEKDIKDLEMEVTVSTERLERRNNRLRGLIDETKVNKDCLWYMVKDILADSGIYNISVNGINALAYCDMDTDSGGWTTIFSRDDILSNEFNRSWNEYKDGFGIVPNNYWIGNEIIHKLTKARPSELYFKLTDNKNLTKWAKYSSFVLGSEEEKFTLNVNDTSYEGTAGDALTYGNNYYWSANKMAFSTYDRDNDRSEDTHCGRNGGWWSNKCGVSYLTTPQIWWMEKVLEDWTKVSERKDLKKVAMMIRF